MRRFIVEIDIDEVALPKEADLKTAHSIIKLKLKTLEPLGVYSQGHMREISDLEKENPWNDDPEFTRVEWATEVMDDNTRQGYWQWVHNQRETRQKEIKNS